MKNRNELIETTEKLMKLKQKKIIVTIGNAMKLYDETERKRKTETIITKGRR